MYDVLMETDVKGLNIYTFMTHIFSVVPNKIPVLLSFVFKQLVLN